MTETEIDFPRGTCPIRLFGELDDAARPVVFFFMDGFGPRDTLYAMAERLAGEDYRVILPHLFYENLPDATLTIAGVLGGTEKAKMMAMLGKLDQPVVNADVAELLAFCDSRFGTAVPIGATGYCMGGRFALTAATLRPRVRLAASFHGATLAPEAEAGVHHRLAGTRASVYVGIAATDPMFGAEEEGRLAQALREADIDHTLETYAGTNHGFTMADLPVFNPAAAERHWSQLLARLATSLA